jgi:hypothetical protein
VVWTWVKVVGTRGLLRGICGLSGVHLRKEGTGGKVGGYSRYYRGAPEVHVLSTWGQRGKHQELGWVRLEAPEVLLGPPWRHQGDHTAFIIYIYFLKTVLFSFRLLRRRVLSN